MQAEERFGLNTDPDGDGFTNELTVADLTAVSIFQATLAVPGHVSPNDPGVEQANLMGEALFNSIGCATCHATLPLTANNNPGLPGQPGWIYFEPNPYNPSTGPATPTYSPPPNLVFLGFDSHCQCLNCSRTTTLRLGSLILGGCRWRGQIWWSWRGSR